MRTIVLSLMLCLTLITVGCQPVEMSARDSAAALGGTISYAQTKLADKCKADPTQLSCQSINRGVAGQNALVTAVETYCGWSTVAPPPDPTTKCVVVKGAEPALKSAIANANRLVTEIRTAIQ